jgi:hypothetical protein
MSVVVAPASMSMLPVTGCEIRFVAHTATPPEESGSGAPKKKLHGAFAPHMGSLVHWMEVSPAQRWLLKAVPPALGSGPAVVH